MKKCATKTSVLILAIVIACISILTGCESVNKEIATIYLHLEKAAKEESNLSKYQKDLNNLQKQENDLYTSILDLKVTSRKIDPILEKARESLQKRQKLIQNENSIIENSYKEVKKIKTIMEKIDDQALRNKSEKVAKSIKKRYEIFKKIYYLSNENIKTDQKLYNYLQQKNIHIKNYNKQIKKLNKDTNQLKELEKKFNVYTDQYNNAKMTLYKAGNLKWSSK